MIDTSDFLRKSWGEDMLSGPGPREWEFSLDFYLVGKLRQKPGYVDKAMQWVKGKGKSLGHWRSQPTMGMG